MSAVGPAALGVVAYRLLTGRLPFDGKNVQELSSQVFYATPALADAAGRRAD